MRLPWRRAEKTEPRILINAKAQELQTAKWPAMFSLGE